jgi:hypothetical protein
LLLRNKVLGRFLLKIGAVEELQIPPLRFTLSIHILPHAGYFLPYTKDRVAHP